MRSPRREAIVAMSRSCEGGPCVSRRALVASVIALPAIARAQAPAAAPRVIEAREGKLRLAPAPTNETVVWGFDGQVPGPLLRIRKGEELRLRLVNKLAQPTAIHWQGVRIVNAMDGVAGLTQQPVAPEIGRAHV